jgi:hypothetical protein
VGRFHKRLYDTGRGEVSITIVLATPWHVDDIIGRIRQSQKTDPEFPKFNFLKFPAMSERYPTGTLFPERFSRKWYTQRRAILDEYGFYSLMQLDPKKRGGNMLNTECVVRHKRVCRNTRRTCGGSVSGIWRIPRKR